MKFDLTRQYGQTSARKYLEKMIEGKNFIEIKDIANKSQSQNAYAHLLLSWLAFELGESIEWIKQVLLKQIICPEIFKVETVSQKTGEVSFYYRSFSELSKTETMIVIDKFRNYASIEFNIYLPEANENELLKSLETELDKVKNWI
jgi:hypothetical protein